MILIVSAALWMALMRPRWEQLRLVVTNTTRPVPWHVHLGLVDGGVRTLLTILTLAYFIIRLVPPRPARAELVRQPGVLFLEIGIVVGMLLWIASAFVRLVPWTNVLIAFAQGLPWFVAVRRHRSLAEPGWIEGLGRFQGIASIISTATVYPMYLLLHR